MSANAAPTGSTASSPSPSASSRFGASTNAEPSSSRLSSATAFSSTKNDEKDLHAPDVHPAAPDAMSLVDNPLFAAPAGHPRRPSPPPLPSDIRSRLRTFLPQLHSANASLSQDRQQQPAYYSAVQIQSLDDAASNGSSDMGRATSTGAHAAHQPYVEMNVGLGVLEARDAYAEMQERAEHEQRTLEGELWMDRQYRHWAGRDWITEIIGRRSDEDSDEDEEANTDDEGDALDGAKEYSSEYSDSSSDDEGGEHKKNTKNTRRRTQDNVGVEDTSSSSGSDSDSDSDSSGSSDEDGDEGAELNTPEDDVTGLVDPDRKLSASGNRALAHLRDVGVGESAEPGDAALTLQEQESIEELQWLKDQAQGKRKRVPGDTRVLDTLMGHRRKKSRPPFSTTSIMEVDEG